MVLGDVLILADNDALLEVQAAGVTIAYSNKKGIAIWKSKNKIKQNSNGERDETCLRKVGINMWGGKSIRENRIEANEIKGK